MIEALVGRVEAGREPVTGQPAGVVGRIAVGEAVGQDEVELLGRPGLVEAPARQGGAGGLRGTGGARGHGRADAEHQARQDGQDDRQAPVELEGFHIEAFRWRGDDAR